MCASRVLHRLCSSLLQLIRGFLSRCLVSSVVLCHGVIFVVFPIFDVSRPCTSICCIHRECCRWHWSSCLLMGSLLSSSGLSLSFHFCSPLWIRVCVQFCWIAEWCWGCSGSPQFPEMVLLFRFPSFVVSPSLLLRSPLLCIRSLWTLLWRSSVHHLDILGRKVFLLCLNTLWWSLSLYFQCGLIFSWWWCVGVGLLVMDVKFDLLLLSIYVQSQV